MAEATGKATADTAGASAGVVTSEVVDMLKQLAQVTSQANALIQQLTQASTTSQTSGQRVDRTDTVDIGEDEAKKNVAVAQAVRTINADELADVASYRSSLRSIQLQMLSNMVQTCHGASQVTISAVGKAQENLSGVNLTDVVEAVLGGKVAEEASQ